MEAHAPFDRGWLVVQRRTPKVPEGFSGGFQGCSIGPRGSTPPFGGIPFRDLPAGLGHDLGHPKQLLGPRPCTGSPIVIPDSVCPRVAIETLGGLAFEPLDHNGLGAQFLSLEGIGWGEYSPPIG